MNLKRLQGFRAVIESGSVTNAARRLHMTQPALSRIIRDLEQELGIALFVRQHQRLVPTTEARVFFREAERALAAVDQIVDIARDIRTLQGAHLRVVASMMTAFGIMPAAVKAFADQHPRARVSLDIKDLRDIADWVTTGPFEVGMTVMPLDDVRIECEPLATVHCLLVLPQTHRFARRGRVPLKDLEGERMVLPSPGNLNRDRFAAAFASAGAPYGGSFDTPSAFSACQFVAQGLGLAVVDPFTFKAASGLAVVARPTEPPIELSFGFFFPANRPRSALVSAFVQATRKVAATSAVRGGGRRQRAEH
jgi:DNA-binding transcriptional LysR family regulator